MLPKRLGLRLMLLLAGVLIAYGALYAFLYAGSQGARMLEETRLGTLRLANTVKRSTRYDMLHARSEDLHRVIENIGGQKGIEHVRILNKDGKIMYSSNASEVGTVVDRKAEACYQCHEAEKPLARLDQPQRSRIYSAQAGHRVLAAIDVIYNEPSCWSAECHEHPQAQSVLGVVDIGVSLEEMDQRVAGITRNSIIFGLVATLLVCGLVGIFVQRFINRPVRRLLEGTRRVANGDLDSAIPVDTSDELGHLARSFNRMTDDLKKVRAELRTWAETLEKQVEEKTRDLKVAQAQVLRSEKLSSLGLMAAGVAHELNSPLTGVLTYAHLLLRKAPLGSQQREDLQLIVNETNRCSTIINQLLDFSRERTGERKPHDLNRLIERAVSLVEHQALFHNIRIERDLASQLPSLLLDAGQLEQVFLNLLINAGEAMTGGGILTIQAHVQTAEGETPTSPGAAGNRVVILFRDTGNGIPPEALGKVFDPFFTSKEVGKGTGLGLAVSYGIIQRHGGTIEVESTVGKGTTFTITLPVEAPHNTAP